MHRHAIALSFQWYFLVDILWKPNDEWKATFIISHKYQDIASIISKNEVSVFLSFYYLSIFSVPFLDLHNHTFYLIKCCKWTYCLKEHFHFPFTLFTTTYKWEYAICHLHSRNLISIRGYSIGCILILCRHSCITTASFLMCRISRIKFVASCIYMHTLHGDVYGYDVEMVFMIKSMFQLVIIGTRQINTCEEK